MKNFKIDLIASLIGTAAGTAVWLIGLSSLIWPAHPQLAAFLLTIAVTVTVRAIWPAEAVQPTTASRPQP